MLYYAIRNYRRYQHFKTRRPPWIKMYNDLLRDHEFACLPDAAKFHVVGLMLLASKCDNRIPGDPAYLAAELHITDPIDFNLLLDAGWLVHAAGRRAWADVDLTMVAPLTDLMPAPTGMTTPVPRNQLAIDLSPNNVFGDSNLCKSQVCNIRNDLIEVEIDKSNTVHLAGTDHPSRGLSKHRAQKHIPLTAAAEVAALRAARTSRAKRKPAGAGSPAAAAAGDEAMALRGGPTSNSTHPTTAATLRARFPLAATALTPNEDGDPIVAFLASVPHPDAYLRVVCETLAAQTVTPEQARRAVSDWFTNSEPPNIRKFRGYLRTAPDLATRPGGPDAWAAYFARRRAENAAST